MVVKFYHFEPSPPCRAVYMTLKALQIEHEVIKIDTWKSENETPEYRQINPRGKVPAIIDGELHMGER